MRLYKDEHGIVRCEMNGEELREHGILWMINRVCFHPHGFALAMTPDDGSKYELWGNGHEPWQFPEDVENILFDNFNGLAEAIREAARELDILEEVPEAGVVGEDPGAEPEGVPELAEVLEAVIHQDDHPDKLSDDEEV